MGYVLVVERVINAPTEVVHRARTEREITRMFDSTSDLTGEVRIGGKRIAKWGPEDGRCRVTQTFLEISPERIVYSELLEVPPSPVYTSIITETIQEQGGKTFFQFHVEGFPTAEERDMHREGYNIVLDRLEAYLTANG
jgi:uncharacterized protein YndB with AHSA1/START domain